MTDPSVKSACCRSKSAMSLSNWRVSRRFSRYNCSLYELRVNDLEPNLAPFADKSPVNFELGRLYVSTNFCASFVCLFLLPGPLSCTVEKPFGSSRLYMHMHTYDTLQQCAVRSMSVEECVRFAPHRDRCRVLSGISQWDWPPDFGW